MNISYVVTIDLTPALDAGGWMDDDKAARIAYKSSGFPDGATIRLNVGRATGGCFFKLNRLFDRAGIVELTGSNPEGLRTIGAYLSGVDPFAVV